MLLLAFGVSWSADFRPFVLCSAGFYNNLMNMLEIMNLFTKIECASPSALQEVDF